MEKNLFEIATRNRYRFTYKGVMTVEDLWDLNVEALDAIFKALNRNKKTADEDSLLAVKNWQTRSSWSSTSYLLSWLSPRLV